MVKTNIGVIYLLVLLQATDTPTFTLPIILSMLCGFSIRLGLDWSNSNITFKRTITQLIYAISLSYISLFVWKDYDIKHNIVYTTFTISLFSIMIVSELSKVFEVGLKTYTKQWIRNLIAKENDNI